MVDLVEQDQLESLVNAVTALAPPKPLPEGWILKESRSQPSCFYYFNHFTGECSWHPPGIEEENLPDGGETGEEPRHEKTRKRSLDHINRPEEIAPATVSSGTEPPTNKTKHKKPKSDKPDKVRVLHILKKHKGARRPSSWRVPNITISKDEAVEELKGLLELLHEVEGDPKELRATMEELARTESDCSSAKRGGDLGFFGPKKMQPAFEDASFKLNIGQLSDIIETSSGVHVILRIG